MLQRTLPAGFIAPCLPTKTDRLPSGGQWLHEIKHDGFRIIARKKGAQVRLYSRPGNDLTRRFPLIVNALARLRSRSCIIDGEAVACDDKGVASFDLVRHHRANDSVFLFAFDLIELNGDDLRRDPLEVRKATLASILAKAGPGIRFNEHIGDDGPTVFAHACKMGLEGIVSKRLGSRYRSSRSKDWLKFKNPAAPGGEARGGGGLGRETLEMTTRTHFSFRINARTAKASGRSPANAPGFLDRDEAFALQAFDHSKRRRQQLAAFAVMPTSACDRRLDAGGQELDHYPFVTRLHWQFSRVGKTDSVLPAIYSRPRLKIFKPKI